ncbi:AraC family transcriptional regulator [Burkholderia multivorans]|uniref:AraC family transcriptional regulator n=1 Tax=Burkholderia multivorans TaxID=87883 RepID=UPI0007565739|nr:AraC family transcriptional regulator [Burkholderia multivorans]KVV27430.1 AraC family transcriptional regulator [Burkholderia multivorans]MBU9202529.1 AraC family transcriptional regulator [Burkholderia multivorans]MCA8386010.1 AraC family transcriptional regulator [Burkholderia multivorans]MCO8314997.1 AraC family transcriptional regulator [Burkholderia multivorans]MCO8350161.1 AraC family transcriptional regulator [Burkholderia multivorans]
MPDTLPPVTPDAHDLVSELLLGMRLSGVQYRRIQVARPFGLSFGQAPGRAQFHFVGRGPVLLRDAAGTTMQLEAGDAILLPHGSMHTLVSDPDVPCREIGGFEVARICDSVASVASAGAAADGAVADSAGGDALIFSACMELDLGGMQPLVGTMPEFMHVGTLLARYPEIRPMLDAMERESCAERAGFAGILARLADVVAAFIVRGWVECGCGDASGWVQALREPKLGRAIVALHRDPGRNWSVAELAAEAGVSRSVFAERFLAATGMTPVRYLTELRMRLAARWIARDREAIETVAYRLGYGSLAAFSRAFKRVVGRPPGALRADADADADAAA